MPETFSLFKQKFYSRIPDLSVFDCEEYNLLKVVLDGLKVEYKSRAVKNQAIFENFAVTSLIFLAKRIKYRRQIKAARRLNEKVSDSLSVPYFFFDNGRVAELENAKKVSFYFNKIENYLGSDNCVTIYQGKTSLTNGVSINDLFFATLFNSYSSHEKKMIRELRNVYRHIKQLGVFDTDELFNIRVAMNKFFDEYRLWNYILKEARVKFALFDEHYHREGFILALKRRNIAVWELQHGLIAIEDIFYVFPKEIKQIASKALFPQKIFTYGKYWSDVLSKGYEFKSNQIDVLGVYQELNTHVSEEQKKEILHFVNDNQVILVTTQTFLHNYFIEYVLWLSADLVKKGSSVKIIVKNHPSEKTQDYAALMVLENVKLANINTEYLLSICAWHISSYSTTLYDATKYNCLNFSLYIQQCEDYISTFVKEGISELLLTDQNPVAIKTTKQALAFDKRTLYEEFESHKKKLKQIEKV